MALVVWVMPELQLRKLYNSLAPFDDEGMELMEKLKGNVIYKCVITLQRNAQFHRKFFAMLSVAYDAFEPLEKQYKGVTVAKQRKTFRNDITVLAGYYDAVYKIDGSVKLVAKSISFAKMTQDEFEALYSAAINVVLQRVLTHYTRDDLDRVVNEILGFG